MMQIPLRERVVCKMSPGIGENMDRTDGFVARFGVGSTVGLEVAFPL